VLEVALMMRSVSISVSASIFEQKHFLPLGFHLVGLFNACSDSIKAGKREVNSYC